jgi:hypothetical protein
MEEELVCRVRLCSDHLIRFKEVTAERVRSAAAATDTTDGGFN